MSSYWKVFRLVFVIFSLYLVGDVIYRWEGFRYYASLLDFIPSVALIIILWTGTAACIAFLLWMSGVIFSKLSELTGGISIQIEHVLASFFLAVVSGLIVFTAKKIWPSILDPSHIKVVALIILLTSISITLLLHSRVHKWFDEIHERITPLVWIFGSLLLLSIPVVTYQALSPRTGKMSHHAGQTTGTDHKQPNIILITFDALSARNMSVYGYERPTTPFVSKWAESASLFTNVHAESNSTRPASESLMTGKRVWTHGTYGLENYYDAASEAKIENIGHLLKVNGYYNVALIQNYLASPERMGMSDSFHDIPHCSKYFKPDTLIGAFQMGISYLFGNKIILHDWMFKNDFLFYRVLHDLFLRDLPSNRKDAGPVFERAVKILHDKIQSPFFIWIHLYPPHDPYMPPEPYAGMFDSSSDLRTARSQAQVLPKIYGKNPCSHEELLPVIFTLRSRYDEFIRYCDNQFRSFIESIETMDISNKTVIILSADHGEIISTSNVGHGRDLDEPETYIPLIIRTPDQRNGHAINDLVGQIDIPATILDLAGIPIPSWMEGRSLLPLMKGESLAPRPSFSMEVIENPSMSPIEKGKIALWDGDYKLIHYLQEGESTMYDLKNDPNEKDNILHKNPEKAQRLFSILQDNLQEANRKIRAKDAD